MAELRSRFQINRRVGCILALACWPAMAWSAEVPGLAVTFKAEGSTAADFATLPNIALFVEAGKPPTPFTPKEKFSAIWEGSINADLRSEYFFAAELNGTLKLEINGATVLDRAFPRRSLSKAVQLNKGANKVRATFTNPARGDAFVRVSWTDKGTNTSPIPQNGLAHTP